MNNYTDNQIIGLWAFGTVYKVTDSETQETVAIKEINLDD
jgi:serine/threonine protein kinase